MSLNDKQTRFALEYMVDLNATQAAIRAGYSPRTAVKQGHRLLTNADIGTFIAQARKDSGEKLGISREKVIKEIARIAFFDIRKLLREDGEPLPLQDLDDDTAAAIAGVETATERERGAKGDEGGVTYIRKYKLADKLGGLEKLAKHLGLYELDNKQKADPLVEMLGGMSRSALPVVPDGS